MPAGNTLGSSRAASCESVKVTLATVRENVVLTPPTNSTRRVLVPKLYTKLLLPGLNTCVMQGDSPHTPICGLAGVGTVELLVVLVAAQDSVHMSTSATSTNPNVYASWKLLRILGRPGLVSEKLRRQVLYL